MSTTVDRILTTLLVVAALAISVALVRREFFPSQADGESAPRYMREWRDILPATRLAAGDPHSPVTIVEFTDFECPACKAFHGVLTTVLSMHADQVSYSLAHFPLTQHRSAERAARAAECAHTFGSLAKAIDVLFAYQDSLGNADWPWFEAEIRLQDKDGFHRCMAEPGRPPMVTAGRDAGLRLKIHGTPTILLNGWRYRGAPSDTEFVRAVEDLLEGRKPYSGFPRKELAAPRERMVP